MNDFESTLSTALRAEAEEISMNVDLTNADQELNRRLDAAEVTRGRKRAVWAAAAVAVVVVAIGTAVVVRGFTTNASPPPASSPSPSKPPVPIDTSTLSPNVSIALPGWTALAFLDSWDKDAIRYGQTSSCAGHACPEGADRVFSLITPSYFYAPNDPTRMVTTPTYVAYVAAWDSIEANGMGTVRDRRVATVDGRPAVLMTVDFTTRAAGLIACETDIEAPADCWNANVGRTTRAAIIDGGAAGPLLLMYAVNTDNPDKAGLSAEMDAVLATVKVV